MASKYGVDFQKFIITAGIALVKNTMSLSYFIFCILPQHSDLAQLQSVYSSASLFFWLVTDPLALHTCDSTSRRKGLPTSTCSS